MKKYIRFLMCNLLVLSLAACSGGAPPAASQPQPASEENSEEKTTEASLSAEGESEAGEKESPPSSPYKYSMASGTVGGNFYLMGGGMAQVINKYLSDYFLITSETTGGGAANLGIVQSGDAEFGIAMTSSLYEATMGEAEWTGGVKHDKLRGALPLYPSWLTVYVLKSSGIQSMQDFNDKIIGLASKGGSADTIFRKFFKDQGIELKQVHNDGHGATATALGDGVIDGALLFSYPPFAAIAELESTKELNFIPLSAEEQAALTGEYGFYTADVMPAGSYKGVTKDINTVSEWNMLITSVDVPEEQVYLIVKALFEHQEDMMAVHASAKYMLPENCVNFNIPLHAGAVRYLKEIGVQVPEELIPPEYSE